MRPSGDHVTSLSPSFVSVRRRGFVFPSLPAIHTSEDCSFESYEGSVTENTTHFPSGLRAGAATRFIIHIDSCISACLPAVCAPREVVANRATRKIDDLHFTNINFSPGFLRSRAA